MYLSPQDLRNTNRFISMRTFACSQERERQPILAIGIGIGIAIAIAIGFIGGGKPIAIAIATAIPDSDSDFIRDGQSNVELTENAFLPRKESCRCEASVASFRGWEGGECSGIVRIRAR